MILLHHPEVELSRNLLASKPEDVEAIEWGTDAAQKYEGPPPSAFPTVVIDVPDYMTDRPRHGEDGEFMGMERVAVTGGKESLRMPASWQAVESYVAFVEDRARLNPVA